MVHAKLGVGADNSGKLVAHVREKAATLTTELGLPTILGDGPPGTGCPVIASVTGVDYVLMVTEPTVSGVHDLKRVLELIKHFGIKAFVIINKYDLNLEMVQNIKTMSEQYNSSVIAEIPFDRSIHEALMKGETIIEYGKGAAFDVIKGLWKQLKQEIS
jgi:MinD superfamily P-loop ATPase